MAIDKIVRNIIEDQAVTQPKIAAGAVDNAAVNTSIITGLTELTSVAENDQLIIHDTSADTLKKVTKSNTTTLGSPVFTSVSPDNSQTADGGNITFTITGSGFTAGTNARLISNTGVRLNFDTVTRTNTTTISATIARSSLLVAQSPYDIQVINGEGLSVIGANQITVDNVPVFVTSSGSLGTVTEGDAVDIEVIARDPDSSSAVTFELQSGSLPAGLSLVNQSGDSCRITGTASAVSADTTSNFTLRAFDSASNTTSRAFSITIEDFSMNGLRFNDDSSDYLEKNFSSTQDSRRIFTVSAWIKRANVNTSDQRYWGSSEGSGEGYNSLGFDGSNRLKVLSGNTSNSGTQLNFTSNQVFRDVSAWSHIVYAVDTTQSTESNRVKIYHNGSQITSWSTATYPSQNTDLLTSTTPQMTIGMRDLRGTNANFFDGYLAEMVFIDNQQLAPTSFGETDSNGVWIPKAYSGSYGTNGFHLDFADGADLGNDVSGNDNDFTENNITSIDKVEDTPQNNYATLNPLIPHATPILYKDGNTIAYDSTGNFNTAFSSIGISTGKWYFEAKTSTNNGFVGICKADGIFPAYTAGVYLGHADLGTNSWAYYADSGSYFHNGSATSYGNSWTNTDMIGCALDLDNNKLYFSKNGTFQNSGVPTSGATGTGAISITSGTYLFGVTKDNESSEMQCNFGNPPFAISSGNSDANGYGNFEYAVPSGYFALNSKNLAEYG